MNADSLALWRLLTASNLDRYCCQTTLLAIPETSSYTFDSPAAKAMGRNIHVGVEVVSSEKCCCGIFNAKEVQLDFKGERLLIQTPTVLKTTKHAFFSLPYLQVETLPGPAIAVMVSLQAPANDPLMVRQTDVKSATQVSCGLGFGKEGSPTSYDFVSEFETLEGEGEGQKENLLDEEDSIDVEEFSSNQCQILGQSACLLGTKLGSAKDDLNPQGYPQDNEGEHDLEDQKFDDEEPSISQATFGPSGSPITCCPGPPGKDDESSGVPSGFCDPSRPWVNSSPTPNTEQVVQKMVAQVKEDVAKGQQMGTTNLSRDLNAMMHWKATVDEWLGSLEIDIRSKDGFLLSLIQECRAWPPLGMLAPFLLPDTPSKMRRHLERNMLLHKASKGADFEDTFTARVNTAHVVGFPSVFGHKSTSGDSTKMIWNQGFKSHAAYAGGTKSGGKTTTEHKLRKDVDMVRSQINWRLPAQKFSMQHAIASAMLDLSSLACFDFLDAISEFHFIMVSTGLSPTSAWVSTQEFMARVLRKLILERLGEERVTPEDAAATEALQQCHINHKAIKELVEKQKQDHAQVADALNQVKQLKDTVKARKESGK
ncbi:hypothetical protein HJC23_010633 [Cyclotella cryptica]|uniref:Uncharacterized protein n=1 Tax=Cyclotella cryptica TaxID=29204 RepID=A0ABD3PH50_9STRA